MTSRKRFLRLKEHLRNRKDHVRPTVEYLECSDMSLQDESYLIETDENGFIETGVAIVSGRPTIYFVGGSFVESSFAHPSRRFVAQVANRFDNLNVINAAYSGTTLLQACLLVIGKMPFVAKPGDWIIVCAPQSDANAFADNAGYWNSSNTYSPIVPFNGVSSWEGSFSDTHAILDALSAFISGMGMNFALITSPFRRCDFSSDGWLRRTYRRDRNQFTQAEHRRREFDATIRQYGLNMNGPFLDLSSLIDGDPGFFYDELHLNELGQDHVSSIIGDFVEKQVRSDFSVG